MKILNRNLKTQLWQRVQLAASLFMLSMTVLCCAPYPVSQREPGPLISGHRDYGYILDDNASCEIPDSAEVIHLPQMHEISSIFEISLPEDTMHFLEESIAHSQFLLTKLMVKEKFKVVFNEGSKYILTRKHLDKYDIYFSITNQEDDAQYVSHRDIPAIFNREFSEPYDHLTPFQKNILTKGGAVLVSFGLNHIQAIHRVMTPSESAQLHFQVLSWVQDQKEVKEEIKTIIQNKDNIDLDEMNHRLTQTEEDLSHLNQEFEKFALDDREQMLYREVQDFFDRTNKTLPAVIVYGAAHDFSDDFKDYNFYILPYACTLPHGYLKSPFYARSLMEMASQIQENPNSLLDASSFYQKSVNVFDRFLKEHIEQGGVLSDKTLLWNSIEEKYESYGDIQKWLESLSQEARG